MKTHTTPITRYISCLTGSSTVSETHPEKNGVRFCFQVNVQYATLPPPPFPTFDLKSMYYHETLQYRTKKYQKQISIPLTIDSAILHSWLHVTLFPFKKSHREPFSWNSVMSHRFSSCFSPPTKSSMLSCFMWGKL